MRDTGLLHRLLGIGSRHDLLSHPKVGASWEGFVIEQILMLDVRNPWFWGTHAGAELDLIVDLDGERVGEVEVKRTDQPRLMPSIRSAMSDLELDRWSSSTPGSTDSCSHRRWRQSPPRIC